MRYLLEMYNTDSYDNFEDANLAGAIYSIPINCEINPNEVLKKAIQTVTTCAGSNVYAHVIERTELTTVVSAEPVPESEVLVEMVGSKLMAKLNGRWFTVLATFTDQARCNDYLRATNEAYAGLRTEGVLCVRDGIMFVADNSDMGKLR